MIRKTTNGGVGINDHHQTANTLTIYPNPTSIDITIETPTKGQLSIINPNGQQLITRQITEPQTQIDISNLPNGLITQVSPVLSK
ncbi:MAG: T9SS type A sorting domain-containing protein [Methylococcales bacterium]|nr:T9SS type A sorting domain-containing protein [Methylococcales bacterium]